MKLYLVVDHHVYRAVCGVERQVGQVERLVNDTLARECSVAVQQDRHHLWSHLLFHRPCTNARMISLCAKKTTKKSLTPCLLQCLRSRTALLWSSPAPLGPLLPDGRGWPSVTWWRTCCWLGWSSCDTFPSDISHHQSPESRGTNTRLNPEPRKKIKYAKIEH